MPSRAGSRRWHGRACRLLAAALAGTCAWRKGLVRSTAFSAARDLQLLGGGAFEGTGGAQRTSAPHRLSVARRASDEREVWGGNENMLSKERPLPPNADRFGDSIWFDLTLKKPLGLQLVDGPDGPNTGIGVGDVQKGGSAYELMTEALAEGAEPSMWVQEGDEIVQVEGQPCDGSRERAVQMVMAAGDSVTLTFSRPARGFIKVVFPGGLSVTSPRGARLSKIAEKAGYDSGCDSFDGRDSKCWYKDPATGEVYCLPLNVPGVVPSAWRESGEEGLRPGEGQFESWLPLRLVPAPEEFNKALAEEAKAKAQAAKEAAKRDEFR